ncbi:MAG: hypothetical protein OEY91_10095 [Nitrospirota bacterium]|nr:hypothetical protein [Nitrospirota bacterium]
MHPEGLQFVFGYAGGEEDGCPMTNVGHDGGASGFLRGCGWAQILRGAAG